MQPLEMVVVVLSARAKTGRFSVLIIAAGPVVACFGAAGWAAVGVFVWPYIWAYFSMSITGYSGL